MLVYLVRCNYKGDFYLIGETLGTKLRGLRKERGLTQQKVAMDLNLAQQSYSNYEHGERLPDLNTFLSISQYYHVSMEFLLGLEDGADRRPEMAAYMEFVSNAELSEKYKNLVRSSKEMLFFYENLPNEDREDLIELARLKYRRILRHEAVSSI